MFQLSYSPNLKWEVKISWSKNAALPVVAANYLLDFPVELLNKPNISDIRNMEALAITAQKITLIWRMIWQRNSVLQFYLFLCDWLNIERLNLFEVDDVISVKDLWIRLIMH